jgi:hypothetical protein
MSAVVAEHTHAFRIEPLSMTQLASHAPAAFAAGPSTRTTTKYHFISTRQLVEALLEAGFVPTHARQTRSRKSSDPNFARHLLRFQHTRESVTLEDAIPTIALTNAHDGTSSYQLHTGLYRPVCSNGLLTAIGDFGLIHVPHRRLTVVRDVVDAALAMIRDFSKIGDVVRKMAATTLTQSEQLEFARAALAIRYPHGAHQPILPEQVIYPRRQADEGADLWRVFNRGQEALVKGGLHGTAATGRRTQTRSISAIREDCRINAGLWQLAVSLIKA